MPADALFVFLEVVVSLVLAIAALWMVTKVLGDIASSRREVRRLRGPERRTHAGRHIPSPG